MIADINTLHHGGAIIKIDSARGSEIGDRVDIRRLTEEQLNRWGVRYHTVRTGMKLAADYYVDDKMMSFNGIHEMAAQVAGARRLVWRKP